MPHEFLSLESLAAQLGRDRREIEKLVQRGRIPGHRVEGTWRFHPAEIRHWLEQEIRGYTSDELAAVEEAQRSAPAAATEAPVAGLLTIETVQVPLEARTRRSVLEALVEVAGHLAGVGAGAAARSDSRARVGVVDGFRQRRRHPAPPQSASQCPRSLARRLRADAFGNPVRCAAASLERHLLPRPVPRLADAPVRPRAARAAAAASRISR